MVVGVFGDGWVVCCSNLGIVVCIVNFEGECFDNNGNGVIDISCDLDGSYIIDLSEMML